VPVLITDDGETFFDSPTVVAWLETLGVDPRLIPADPLEAVRVRQLEGLADGIMDATVSIVLEGRRPEDKRSEDVIGRQLQKIERGLDRLEQLASGRTWLHGDRMSIGDIATAVAAAFIELRVPQLDWRAGRPALSALVDRMFERDSFRNTTPPAG
jgi:glutathione S-transferase